MTVGNLLALCSPYDGTMDISIEYCPDSAKAYAIPSANNPNLLIIRLPRSVFGIVTGSMVNYSGSQFDELRSRIERMEAAILGFTEGLLGCLDKRQNQGAKPGTPDSAVPRSDAHGAGDDGAQA